ncbi:tRNA pseudouridine(38-40) synthase TruA [Catenovulum adriaticum]|uniref:tRNA pseudouridine synthase A n=1 Tax=Catenovulum adriaticum TaxID=2984846 RepID=A0ABY7AHW9_9ALTE|nr:tRNA pseudouridine(38-40) synthase TruA [Catenovulum sp. TS8]WAJ69198.1 tRNA pseudouridine(38-40) synthase TruA [Catenovulum sp. TS8]
MKFALGIEYDGARYSGWQRQQNVPSVQQALEEALSKVVNKTIVVTCAGRTDSGVHATAQVVHFTTDVQREIKALTLGVNANLPKDIAVKWAQIVDDSFDARYSATARRYRYVIYNNPLKSAILPQGITHCYHDLDATKMHQAAQALVGEKDFTSFRAAHCQSNTPFRNIHQVSVTRIGEYIVIDITANAFLHHMVRNIAGSLMEIGKGEQAVNWISELLIAKDRTLAAATAKPNGLYLVRVFYPDSLNIPVVPMGPVFLPEQIEPLNIEKIDKQCEVSN